MSFWTVVSNALKRLLFVAKDPLTLTALFTWLYGSKLVSQNQKLCETIKWDIFSESQFCTWIKEKKKPLVECPGFSIIQKNIFSIMQCTCRSKGGLYTLHEYTVIQQSTHCYPSPSNNLKGTVFHKQQPPASKYEVNAEVLETAVHPASTRGWLQKHKKQPLQHK